MKKEKCGQVTSDKLFTCPSTKHQAHVEKKNTKKYPVPKPAAEAPAAAADPVVTAGGRTVRPAKKLEDFYI